MVYGYLLLVILGFLAARIALGHVEEATSYGLNIVLNTIGILAGGFTQWAFGTPRAAKDEPPAPPTPIEPTDKK
jgi:hypothetical protein